LLSFYDAGRLSSHVIFALHNMVRRTIYRSFKATNHPSIHRGTTMFNFFTDGFRRWNRYNTTKRELDLLTDRELADLGIMRSDIPRIARDTVSR
jgi:uncharacterized protein YjiS (DUF1127 family)